MIGHQRSIIHGQDNPKAIIKMIRSRQSRRSVVVTVDWSSLLIVKLANVCCQRSSMINCKRLK
uniref:Uncharacterized protein n=1 Tax=Cucumis melo TaxID=3656 RepID=A0A9I9E5C5_CUCME